MKKNYSDPLMFTSRSLLTGIDITLSQDIHDPDDDSVGGNGTKSAVFVNSAFEAPTTDDPVKIVNPVEEAVEEAATSFTTENAGEAITMSPLEVPSVIDEIIPKATEEAATAATTMQ